MISPLARSPKIFLLMSAFAITAGSISIGAVELPSELPGIRMGMSVEELLKARPGIQREGWLGRPIDWKAEKLDLYEKLPTGGLFSNASYILTDGRLTVVTLMGRPKGGDESKARRKALETAVARWGKSYKKRAPEDSLRPRKARAVLTWEDGDWEVVLMLPRNREKGDSRQNALAITVRPASAQRDDPWRDMPMPDENRKAHFSIHDVPGE